MTLDGTDVIQAVAEAFDVHPDDILARDRGKRFSTARHVTCQFLREYTGMTRPEIGRFLEDRDTTTVSNSLRKYRKLCDEPATMARIDLAREILDGPVMFRSVRAK